MPEGLVSEALSQALTIRRPQPGSSCIPTRAASTRPPDLRTYLPAIVPYKA